jgi:hypothetical protein
MKITVDLAHSLIHCPIYWANFIQSLQVDDPWQDVPLRVIQRELKPYRARYRSAGSKKVDYIEFDNEAALTWFMLRWA